MSSAAQRRATDAFRSRMARRGYKRFEVLALESDRELIRSLARRLAEDGPKADEVRQTMKVLVSDEPPKSGGILAALRRSPLVGEEIDVSRPRDEGREIDL